MNPILEYWERTRPKAYITEWYHRHIAQCLWLAYTNRWNLIVEAPPRHGKSELVNVYGPAAWLDAGHYEAMFGLITNSDNLAKKFSTATRNLCKMPLEINRDNQWKVKAQQSLNYTYFSAGIRGQASGHGFDCLLLDDCLKSGAEAKSETVREGVWDGVISTSINRLSPDGIIIGLQARLHQEDTIGKLLKLEHLKFMRLHLPSTNDDGRSAYLKNDYTGEKVVFPPYENLSARYNRDKLDEIKATVSQYYYSAQYQCEPSLGSDIYFDVSKLTTHTSPKCERVWIAMDCANTATIGGSYTAFCAMGLYQGRLKVIAAHRARLRQDEMPPALVEFYMQVFRLTGIMPETALVERAAGGYGVLDYFSAPGSIPVQPVFPLGSKEERAGSVAYVVNQGLVSLPDSGSWLAAWKDEIGGFPLVKFNDQVDAFVHCCAFACRPSEFKPTASIITDDAYRIADDETTDIPRGLSEGFDEVDFGVSEEPWMGEATKLALARNKNGGWF